MKQYKWTLDQSKYLTEEDARRLINTSQQAAWKAYQTGRKIPIRDYFIIDLGLSTGLRVSEISQLVCGDLNLQRGPPSVLVRHGKGNKERVVFINQKFREHCLNFLRWKEKIGEPTDHFAPLLFSSNNKWHITSRALQNVFKKQAARAGLPSYYSIHCLRHTYACQLYIASGYNLRLVQKQLGHSNIKTTEVYADVMVRDISTAVENLNW